MEDIKFKFNHSIAIEKRNKNLQISYLPMKIQTKLYDGIKEYLKLLIPYLTDFNTPDHVFAGLCVSVMFNKSDIEEPLNSENKYYLINLTNSFFPER